MNRVFRLLALLALGGGLSGVQAQLPAAKLTTIHPPGAKVGGTVEVYVAGAHLDHSDRMLFSHPGIAAKSLGDGRRFTDSVAAGVPPGVHSAWVVGHYGASTPRAFAVDTLTELNNAADNHSFEKAQPVSLDSVVNGHADVEKADYYRVTLKKGQVLGVRCRDREIDSRLQGAVLVYDADRREVARGRMRGITVHRAERDGDCFVKVHDFVYRGGAEYFYRLELRAGEVPDHVLPLAVGPTETTSVQVFGAQGLEPIGRSEVSPPKSGHGFPSGVSWRDLQAGLNGINVEGSLVGRAEGTVTLESPDAGEQAITLPVDISGRFYPARDVDDYRFSAKKGEVWQVEIISHRLHGLTDPLVVVQKETVADGKTNQTDVLVLNDADRNFGGDEFDTFHHDAAARLEIKEDGHYRLRVRDAFNSTVADPRRVYRLIVRRPDPDFTLVVQPIARRPEGDRRDVWAWNAVLRQGDVAALRVLVFRRDGFNGEIDVSVDGLPDGIAAGLLRIGGSEKTAELFLRAAENAGAWAGPIVITGRGAVGERKLERAARYAHVNWDIDYDNATTHMPDVRLSDQMVIGVCQEPAPLELIAGGGKTIEAIAGSTVKIPVQVVRRDGFGADLKVKPYGHSALGKIGDATIKGTAGEVVIDLNKYKLPVGVHALHLMTTTKGKYRPTPPQLRSARAAVLEAAAAAKPAEDHARALAEVAALKTLSDPQRRAVQREADEAAVAAKGLVEKRTSAEKAAKDLEAKQKPSDITADFYSMPFVLKVNPKK